MGYAFVRGYGGNVIVAPCLVTFLEEVQRCVQLGLLDVTNEGEIGNLAHRQEGWTASDHNPFVQHNGLSYVRAADFGGPGYPKLIDFWNDRYRAKDPRVYPYGYTNSNLPAPRGLTIWFGNGATRNGTDGNHAHLSVNQANGSSPSSSGWVPALDDTSPWGLENWLRGGGSAPAVPEHINDTEGVDLLNLIIGSARSKHPGWVFLWAGNTLTHVLNPATFANTVSNVRLHNLLATNGRVGCVNYQTGKPLTAIADCPAVDDLDSFGVIVKESP